LRLIDLEDSGLGPEMSRAKAAYRPGPSKPGPTEQQKFGAHLRSLRQARGRTQDALAKASGLSNDTIRRLEQGNFSPSMETLKKLCLGLSLSLSTLFESFELGSEDDARQLGDLLIMRPPEQLAVAAGLLRLLFDHFDKMEGPKT